MPASREAEGGLWKAQLGETSAEELSSEQRRTMEAGKAQCLETGSCAAQTSQEGWHPLAAAPSLGLLSVQSVPAEAHI